MARTRFSKLLDETGALAFVLRLRGRAASPWLTVLTYHRVADPATAENVDANVVDARPEHFEEQVAFLKRYCHLIGLDDVLAFRRGAPLPHNPVLLTFDDGYLDNYETVLPILVRHGVPAVFFIATRFIEERRLFWWDRVSYLVKHSRREAMTLTYPRAETLVLGTSRAERLAAARRAMVAIKSHFDLDLERYLEELERASDVTISREHEREMVDGLLMNWDQIRLLRKAGMSVQSHTRNHRVLYTLSEAGLRNELEGSKRDLEDVLGERIGAVAYPVGKALNRAPHARNAIRAAGYELGFTNGTGTNPVWRFDPMDVRRLSLEVDVEPSYFRGMVALPYFAYEPHTMARNEW
ncbi:polysaccharide deacetylase family protein [Pendulispora albinea]|uniref:Polysaccharide deacetylase family protein n=1 Tax=Pendulispora albinea TaxID=2741071 RepID=A0ABZ2M9E0_9BACT